MKLKYYMRGLAVGILLTTIILTIANAGNRPLTDAQIRQRARELGMIESDSVRLSVLQGDDTSASGSGTPESDTPESIAPGDVPAGSPESETSESGGSESSAPGDTSAETPRASEGDSQTESGGLPQQAASMGAQIPSGEPDEESVSFQVKSGASSSSVSKELAAAGLIEDAAAFDTFLCNNGYSRKIRPGTYQIPQGAAEEDIAKIITQ